MKTKVVETKRDLFIPDREGLAWNQCGNFDVVTRTLYVKIWKFPWIPVASQTCRFNVDGAALGSMALGYTMNYDVSPDTWDDWAKKEAWA